MMHSTCLLSRIALLSLLLSLAACKHSTTNDGAPNVLAGGGVATPMSVLTLRHAEDCTDYKQYLADALLEDLLNRPYYYPFPVVLGSGEPEMAMSLADVSSAPTYVSQTNTQEQGVDEADFVEAGQDGLLYHMRYGVLHILQGTPATTLDQLGSLDLGIQGARMYLDDANKRVVVIGNQYESILPGPIQTDSLSIAPYPYDRHPSLQVLFIDVTNPAEPTVTKQLSVEGGMVNSRRIGDRIQLVTSYRWYWPLALQHDQAFNELLVRYWQLKSELDKDQETIIVLAAEAAVDEKTAELVAEIKRKVDAAIQAAGTAELLPATEWVNGEQREDAALLGCTDVMYPDVKISPSLLTVISIDTDGANAAATAILNNAWQVYASQKHLYVAQGSGGWWWGADQRQQTVIYQFDIGAGAPVYTATGRVDGWVKDAYSFSDYAGHLRLVTTQNKFDDTASRVVTDHALRVLKDNGAGDLQQISSVQGFGQGERVFAVRFTGDKGFVVTFRQIDPLFTFDLSDPEDPRLMGELEMPGFSTYMHPLGEDHLLTIGRDGNAQGATNGIQLQIFDVSDLANPRVIHRYEPDAGVNGYSWSAANYDPHAFTFYAEQGLLAIPMSVWDYANGRRFNGIVVLSVNVDDGIAELGRVNHSDLAYELYCSDAPSSDDWRYHYCQQGGADWWSYPRRSVFMTDATDSYLFSLSDVGVKAALARQPDVVLGSHVYPKWTNDTINIGLPVLP